MQQSTQCPFCNEIINIDDLYCSKCGHILKEKGPSTKISTQIIIYLISFFFAPFGIFPAIKYIRQTDNTSKKIGYVALLITAIALLVAYFSVASYLTALKQQLDIYQGL